MPSVSCSPSNLIADRSQQYSCQANLNLYDSAELKQLATQALAGRQLTVCAPIEPQQNAIAVQLCEDDYRGWIAAEDVDLLTVADQPYQSPVLTTAEIRSRLPAVIEFTHRAMQQPNHYLWGGTTGPNFDCSGLMQTGFASIGVWLPRDSYQQEAFTQPIALEQLEPGDLVFFGTPKRANHVGLYLGSGYYIHSSGRDRGRNGIGIDHLSVADDPVSYAYFQLWRRGGRITESYQPQGG